MLPTHPSLLFALKNKQETCAPLITAKAITAITSNQQPDWPVLAKTYQISWSGYFLGSSAIAKKNQCPRLQLPTPEEKQGHQRMFYLVTNAAQKIS